MSFYKLFFLYLFSLAVFLIIDLFWLGLIARSFYQKQLALFFKGPVNWTAAFIFYFLFVAGILIFVVIPSLNKGSIVNAVVLGMLFGLFTYAAYDLTNLATLKDWPTVVVIVDMIWGMVLTGSVSISGFLFAKHILK
jgi:uncharacterized membrane protein